MTWRYLFRAAMVLALSVALATPACAQFGPSGSIGPSRGEIAGIIVGIVAVATGVGLLVYWGVHKQSSMTGCVQSGENGLSLIREKDKQTYGLVGSTGDLKTGERVTLKGKRVKNETGKLTFRVQKVGKDYGTCKP